MSSPTEKQAAKILETINRRTAARHDAGDLEGLRAILAAVDKGRELAMAALADLESTPAPEATPAESKPNPGEEKKYQEKIKKQFISRETSDLFEYIISNGGIRPSSQDLLEEYREIPPSYRRADGIPGDEMADMLASDRPECGIATERELLEFFAARRRQARHTRAAA